MASAWLEGLIGSRFSILTHNQVRYEGTLTSVDVESSYIILSKVVNFGTEGRKTDAPDEKSDKIVPVMSFHASDIAHIDVSQESEPKDKPKEDGRETFDNAMSQVSISGGGKGDYRDRGDGYSRGRGRGRSEWDYERSKEGRDDDYRDDSRRGGWNRRGGREGGWDQSRDGERNEWARERRGGGWRGRGRGSWGQRDGDYSHASGSRWESSNPRPFNRRPEDDKPFDLEESMKRFDKEKEYEALKSEEKGKKKKDVKAEDGKEGKEDNEDSDDDEEDIKPAYSKAESFFDHLTPSGERDGPGSFGSGAGGRGRGWSRQHNVETFGEIGWRGGPGRGRGYRRGGGYGRGGYGRPRGYYHHTQHYNEFADEKRDSS
ncbi:putative protein LSM14 [Monocercomonoides exilis]|uniref:putative protein LSM14 n=1 Tax=Monocercomonoides exilis TaxID=2049356 RepID=UPI00355A14FD|nr:putative protein LSM14 [Monocercomonoides exilis]|eukprot:MONOS_807.1-p1 / transcript=MONOS_807.1 / gene=MONOS_807 / organism=Monocercomonoides_exilis_PA203 / gene_product=unspecified product / transcript_product=unspecified product / location=Mono_scaffold00013:176655-178081(+) / protein_length=373 / sequence_SO=supercontig / SO=protein_coding / is_pseudo=false